MSVDTIIDAIIEREGGDKVTNDPTDGGGRTAYGISETSNPEAWKDGKVSEEEARAIYTLKYVAAPGFNQVKDESLKAQLVDFGVNSGPYIAIRNLQDALGLKADGVIGPETLTALESLQGDALRLLNNALVAARVKMFGRIVAKNPSQLKFLSGWLNRALEFLL